MGFAAHAEFFQYAGGGGVAGVEAADDAVQVEAFEAEAEHFAGGFWGVAVAVVCGVEDVADFALAVFFAGPAEDGVADELAGVAQGDGQVDGVTFVEEGGAGDFFVQVGADGVAVAGFPVEVAGDVGVGFVGVQGVQVVWGEGA